MQTSNQRHATCNSPLHVSHGSRERVDSAAALVSGLCSDEVTHRDSRQQLHPWSSSSDGGKFERRSQQWAMPIVTNSWKVKTENCTVWKSKTGRKFSPNPGTIRAKATLKVEGRVKPTENVSAVDAVVPSGWIAETRPTLLEDPRNLHPKGKGVRSCEEEEPETSQNVPLGTIDLGSFEVLSDHGDTTEDDVDVDESSQEATELMPPLPPASWFKKTGTSKHTEVHCGKCRKPCNGDRRDEDCRKFSECCLGACQIDQACG